MAVSTINPLPMVVVRVVHHAIQFRRREGVTEMCDHTGAEPCVPEEVIRENGRYCGGGCASHCDVRGAIYLDSFLRVFLPFP